ncbi:TPA: hypothetical protein N0F65_005622 [Lagenidium giganteum]|uniref:Cysteine protease n=1 Tax=Lagenidium giganteum TaxID=4803 RepID=A0AAV2YWZ1_9STRA|nr:TPA: hypothetical protein N0F65_005622 [Lagenidium giganteum]
MAGAHSRRKLGILSVALITYFNVSGGPWGSEPVISACGPFVGILAVIIFPWIWCLPLALTFAELFTAFPTDGSFCKWVGVAFGRPMGFQVGFWSWVAGVIDNAIYPCLIVDTISQLYAGDFDQDTASSMSWERFAARAAFAVLFMLPCLSSIKIVGHTLAVMGIMIFLPFAVMVAMAIPQVNPSNWLVIRPDRDWTRLISSLYWNYSGFDAAGAYAGEIQNPKVTYPKAMMLTVVMIAITYIIPFFAISGADKPHYTSWDDGSYSVIAQSIGGTWLCIWVLVSSLFGNLGLYVAEMAKDGFQLAGMSDSGLAPPYFAQRDPETGVPRRAIMLSFSIIVLMGMFDFDTILGVDNFCSALSSLVEMCAAVKMRFSHPEIERPYKVNLSDRNLLIVMILPFCVGTFVMINELTKSWTSFILNVIVLCVGYGVQKWLASHPYHQYDVLLDTPRLKDLTLDSRQSTATPRISPNSFRTMKIFVALGCLLASSIGHANALTTELPSHVPVAEQQLWEEFVEYAIEYNKEYRQLENSHDLVSKRYGAFKMNSDRIKEHNAKYDNGEYSFTLGVNALADLTDAEYKQMLGYKRSSKPRTEAAGTFTAPSNMGDLPETWDWREHDVVTPVKNQGQCGSCWAFSAVAALESVYAISTGKLESFSEQELVDCTDGGVDTCNHGGEMSNGFVEIIKNHNGKIDPESVYPYTAVSKGVCNAKDDQALGHFTSYVNVTSGDEDALKAAVATKSVQSVAIDASSFTFQLYRHGVYSWPLCKNKADELDHGVAVAGYGVFKSKDFWLVKNSWGESWGMHGYIMMSRNKKNQCGIATDASYPVMTKAETKVHEATEVLSIM